MSERQQKATHWININDKHIDVKVLYIVFLFTCKYINIVSTWTSIYHKPFNIKYHLKFMV